MSPQYKPSAGSLPAQVVWFFTNNPDEQLSLGDITEKFDTPRGNIHTQLGRSIDAQLLARTRNEDGEYIYSAGPAIGKTAAEPAVVQPAAVSPAPAAPAVPTAPACVKKPHTGLAGLDVASLRVEEGIPFAKHSIKGRNKWEPLFGKLVKPGQSVAIPANVHVAVRSAAAKYNTLKRGTYRVALTGADTARVWRIA